MANTVGIYEPRTMGRLISKMPPVHTFLKDTFFKNRETFTTKKIDVDFVKGKRQVAPFVHPVIGGEVIKNEGYETKTYTPVMVGPEKVTSVDDLLDRSPGEQLYSQKTPAQRAVEKMARDFRELDDSITRREEWMCAQTLLTGQIPIIGKGLNEVIDFGFTNTETITKAADKWDKETADPIGDLRRWHKAVQKSGFVNCDICIMADDVAAAFIKNPKVQKLLDIRNYNLAAIEPRMLPDGVTYIGTIPGLGLTIYTYNEWYLDDWTDAAKPVEKPLIPDGKLLMLSSHAQYSMYYGVITLVDEQTKAFRTVEGNRVPDTWVTRKPARRFFGLYSAPLSVPHEVDSWFVATVL